MIIPSGLAAAPGTAWPLSSALPPMGALASVPAIARAHLDVTLANWQLADLAEAGELVVSELATNAVQASTGPTGGVVYHDASGPGAPAQRPRAAAHRGLGPGRRLPRATAGG